MQNPLKPLGAALGRAFARADEAKKSRAGALIALTTRGMPVWTPRNYEALYKEGFSGNAIGYRCVRMIAEAAASVPWLLYERGKEVSAHPLLRLLARPNEAQAGGDLFELFYAHLQSAGNAYLEAVVLDGEVRELHLLRPDRMKVVPGADGWPEAFEYAASGRRVRFHQAGEPVPILHMKLINPAGDHYGLSPFEAAAKAIDIHNAAGAWNKALLDNGARPSGALIYKGDGAERSQLTAEQADRLRSELARSHQSAANAGRPLLLEGGLEWAAMSHSPRDMDFIEAKHVAAREIALAFGVPPMLLGIPGDNTFANYAEANRTFWRQTVLPLAGRTAGALSHWLGPVMGDDLRLWFDADQVEALSAEREALWARVGAAEFLSDEEKREAVGYGAG